MTRFLLVCLGGAAGSGLRYLVSVFALASVGARFPWGTLAVNVLGSFAIAFVMQLAAATTSISPLMRLTLTTGLLGGFTTYSAFSFDTFQYLQAGQRGIAATYVVTTVIGCLLACFGGFACARALAGTGG